MFNFNHLFNRKTIIIIIVITAVVAVLALLRGSEDTWSCQNGNWVKHGNPSSPQPTNGCGAALNNNTNASIANPAAQNCLQRGGRLEARKDESGGEFAVCKFNNGSECEEWLFYRGECQPGIVVTMPFRDSQVVSPLEITGEARGTWFFEASFPVKLVDMDNNTIAVSFVQAQNDWMTENYVPFKGVLEFTTIANQGYLVLAKDNPSGLPENDLELRIPVKFSRGEVTKLKVYFNNNELDPAISCNKVFAVERAVPKTLAVARAAVEELLKGPTKSEQEAGYFTSLNSGVTLQNMTIVAGVARPEFDENLEKAVGGSCRVSAIRAQITQTLKQFPTIKEVIITINGRSEDILQP